MNLVKIAEILKSASDRDLMQQLRAPDGAAPSYMVLSELGRRKKLRGLMMQPDDQQSVAEDLEMQTAQAQNQGLGAMPEAQQYSDTVQQAPQGYARGGEVVHAAKGWFGEDTGDYGDTDPTYTSDTTPGGLFRTDQIIKPAFSDEQSAQRRKLIASGVSPENASRMVRGEPLLNAPSGAAPTINPNAPLIDNAAAPTGSAPGAGRGVGRPPVPGAAPTPGNVAATSGLGAFNPGNVLAEAYKEGTEGINQYNDYLKQAIAENKAQKNENIGYGLLLGGLGTLGGRSQYAAENIGQGAMMGVQQMMGAEQARQKEGRAMAMDMASAGLKSSEIKSKLAEAGFKGDYWQAQAKEARAKSDIYYPAMASAATTRAAGTNSSDKLDMQEVKALRSDYTKNAVNPMFAKKYPSFESYLSAMGYAGSRGPSGTMGPSNDPLGWRK